MIPDPAIRLDHSSAVPPFEQIRQQVAEMIMYGKLLAGQRLPPVRQLAADLGLANGTVARAYQELETAGLVITRRAAGTRVAVTTPVSQSARMAALAQQAEAYVRTARRLGATTAEICEAVAEATADDTLKPANIASG